MLRSGHFVRGVGNDPSVLLKFSREDVAVGDRKKCSIGSIGLNRLTMISAGYENNCRSIVSGFTGCNRSDFDEAFICITAAVYRKYLRVDGQPIDDDWINNIKAKRAFARCTPFWSPDRGEE